MKIRDFEWWIVAVLGFSAFALSMLGYEILFIEAGIERNLLDLTFHSVKIFTGDFVGDFTSPLPWQLEIARWLAPAVFLYTAFKAVLYFISREFKSFLIRFYKDHIIITSLNEKSRYLITDLLKRGEKVVVLADIQKAKQKDQVEREGAVLVEGNLNDPGFLRKVGAHKAKYFVLVEEDDETNISQAISIYNYLSEYGRKKYRKPLPVQTIHTHVADDIKLNELLELNFFEEFKLRKQLNPNCEIRIFSMYERTARVLFNEYAPDKFVPVRPDSPQTSVAIVGSGALAQSMIIRLAHLAHYANFTKLRISLFHEGDAIIKKLLQNFPAVKSIIDLEAIEQPLELFDMDKFNELNQAHPFSAVYLLLEDDSLSSNVLTKLIHTQPLSNLNVILSLINPHGILNKWYSADLVENINLHKFNIIEETFSEDALISDHLDKLAMIIHEVYLAGLKERNPNKDTHQDWKFLSVSARNQNRDQADHIFVKLRAMNGKAVRGTVSEENRFAYEKDEALVELLSKIEHNRWWANKLLSGWTFGTKEDGRLKQHPDLVEYEELDEPTKDWDRDAVRNMRHLLARDGIQIVRDGG
jgi:hypothetical protein